MVGDWVIGYFFWSAALCQPDGSTEESHSTYHTNTYYYYVASVGKCLHAKKAQCMHTTEGPSLFHTVCCVDVCRGFYWCLPILPCHLHTMPLWINFKSGLLQLIDWHLTTPIVNYLQTCQFLHLKFSIGSMDALLIEGRLFTSLNRPEWPRTKMEHKIRIYFMDQFFVAGVVWTILLQVLLQKSLSN